MARKRANRNNISKHQRTAALLDWINEVRKLARKSK